jgi:hypothetical protein
MALAVGQLATSNNSGHAANTGRASKGERSSGNRKVPNSTLRHNNLDHTSQDQVHNRLVQGLGLAVAEN